MKFKKSTFLYWVSTCVCVCVYMYVCMYNKSTTEGILTMDPQFDGNIA